MVAPAAFGFSAAFVPQSLVHTSSLSCNLSHFLSLNASLAPNFPQQVGNLLPSHTLDTVPCTTLLGNVARCIIALQRLLTRGLLKGL